MSDSPYAHIIPSRYPLGMQSFEDIRLSNKVYVDKTAMLHKLITDGQYYFLSRPRRFGKSLMLSTLQAYFEGKLELFKGLAIYDLEKDWHPRPVIHLSMPSGGEMTLQSLQSRISFMISRAASDLGVKLTATSPDIQFVELIGSTFDKYGEKVVVLIDEYDRPLLDTQFAHPEFHGEVLEFMRSFYSSLKDFSRYIHFVMLTGVTKYSQVNVFSGLNNLTDISLNPTYNALCGISESEMQRYFTDDITVFAERIGLSARDAQHEFKLSYDGYRFASDGENIYNPYSVLSAFWEGRFDTYWYQSGNPNHIVQALSKKLFFNFKELEGYKALTSQMLDPNLSYKEPVALLYQSGYLTIKGYDKESQVYTLGFPNKEVSAAFCQNLMTAIAKSDNSEIQFSVPRLILAATTGSADEVMTILDQGLASFKYEQLKEPSHELHFHLMLHIICMCAGLQVESEVQTTNGRIDLVLKTNRFIYIIEFKINQNGDAALKQILEKDYVSKYRGDSRKVILIGAGFFVETRRLIDWKILD